jgi:phosphoglycolate phosphatase-like HAD superfamily hydrolase
MRLLLFDIDGTLIRSNRAGRAAVVFALERLFGTAGPIDGYDMAGKTDPIIIHDLLSAAGFGPADIEARLADIYELMAEGGRQLFAERGVTPCPGVIDLLEALAGHADIVLGLLTGNVAQTAPLKLAAAGIEPSLFRAGAYGSDASDRNVLPALAMERASALTGYRFAGFNTTVIGDTPADIACARAGGATAVAVASGRHTTAMLAEHRPDYVLPDLCDTTKVLQILLDEDDERRAEEGN